MKVSQEQVLAWTENPVTIKLRNLVNEELQKIVETPSAACLRYGEPHMTHENLVRQDTEAKVLAFTSRALNGDWVYFGEEDYGDSEQIGDNPDT